MIFLSLGSQQYQFNRLLSAVDDLIEKKELNERVFAQTGHSDYFPKNYEFQAFLTQEEYEKKIEEADIVISHAGTGAIIKALKAKKQVIVVPRQAKYGEHADNHQFQIAEFMSENDYVFEVDEMDELMNAITMVRKQPKTAEFAGSGHIIEIIENFIDSSISKNRKNK